jgi:hypothetical protein
MLNQPKALIYVPVDIVETSMVAVRQMPKHLGDAVSWQNSELSACTPTYFLSLVIALFDPRQLKVVGIGAVGI